MKIQDCFQIGFVSKTHGLKGEVVVQIGQEPSVPFSKIDVIYVAEGNNLVPYFINQGSENNGQVIFALEEVETLAKAATLKNKKVYLPDTLKPSSAKGFLMTELIDFVVIDKTLGELGVVLEVFEIPNNPLLQILYQSKEVLIPVNEAFVVGFDKKKKVLNMDLPDGLLEVYLSNSHTQDDGD